MGSLCFLAELISKETGIPSVSFDRVDTLMVIEVLRKAILPETDLKTIEALPLNSNKLNLQYAPIRNVKPKSSKVILTICVTGEGSAIKIKELIEASIKSVDNHIDIIPLGALDTPNIHEFIEELHLKKNIIAIVGTIDPNYREIPYISLYDLIQGEGMVRLKQLLNMETSTNEKNIIPTNKISQFIFPEAIWPNKAFKTKVEILDQISDDLYKKGFVTNGFKVKVYERELLGDTIYRNSIAIPHATTEETIKPVLGILTLNKPILWADNYYANIIFFLVFKENSSEMLNFLYSIGNNKTLLESISKANTQQDIINNIVRSIEI